MGLINNAYSQLATNENNNCAATIADKSYKIEWQHIKLLNLIWCLALVIDASTIQQQNNSQQAVNIQQFCCLVSFCCLHIYGQSVGGTAKRQTLWVMIASVKSINVDIK